MQRYKDCQQFVHFLQIKCSKKSFTTFKIAIRRRGICTYVRPGRLHYGWTLYAWCLLPLLRIVFYSLAMVRTEFKDFFFSSEKRLSGLRNNIVLICDFFVCCRREKWKCWFSYFEQHQFGWLVSMGHATNSRTRKSNGFCRAFG